MAEGRRRDEWSRTLALLSPLCLLANAKLRRGATPFRPSDFDPFRVRSAPRPPQATARDLKAMFLPKKKPKP